MINNQYRRKNSYVFFACTLGIVLFIYVVLRSFLVEPIHDELATLFHYIDYGTIWGKGASLDANNHLLNSFLGKVCYSLFGDHIWAIRLPNVLSFLLFFYAAFRISLRLKIRYLRYIFLVATTCIPYILDYFGYCRGYGMSMAFLFYAIHLGLSLNENFHFGKTALMLFSLLLGCFANLNLILVSGLIVGYFGVKWLILAYKTQKYAHFLQFLFLGVLFLIGLYIPISFAFQLKAGGALYYGTKDGLWLTTGATLSKVVLFTTSTWIKYILLAFFLLIASLSIFLWKKVGAKEFFNQPSSLWIGLIFGNLLAILLLRWLFGINFPEDRVGMQLIFFFMGAVLFALDDFPKIAKIGYIFLIFPVVGWSAFNFTTSVFSPDDRMAQADFKSYKKAVAWNKSSAIYLTQALTYAYHVRKSNPTHFFVPEVYNSHQLSFVHDEVISSKNEFVKYFRAEGYASIHKNPLTWQVLLVKKKRQDWKLIKDTSFIGAQPYRGTEKYYTLNEVNLEKVQQPLKISVQCRVKIPHLSRESLVLVVDKTNRQGKRKYHAFNLGWAAGKHHQYQFDKTIVIHPQNLEKFGLYLYNPNGTQFEILKHRVREEIPLKGK